MIKDAKKTTTTTATATAEQRAKRGASNKQNGTLAHTETSKPTNKTATVD